MTIYSGTVRQSVYITDRDRIEPNTAFASSVEVINCPAFTGSAGCTFKGRPIAFGAEADDRIKRIAEIVAATPKALKMDTWHSCNTTRCLAGWGIHQEGAAGYALEREVGDTAGAGLLLLGLEAAGKFYQTDSEGERAVRAWLNAKLVSQ